MQKVTSSRKPLARPWLLSSGPSPQNQQHLPFCHGNSLRGTALRDPGQEHRPGPAVSPQNPEQAPAPAVTSLLVDGRVIGKDL